MGPPNLHTAASQAGWYETVVPPWWRRYGGWRFSPWGRSPTHGVVAGSPA